MGQFLPASSLSNDKTTHHLNITFCIPLQEECAHHKASASQLPTKPFEEHIHKVNPILCSKSFDYGSTYVNHNP